jgi:hypothetical protein
MNLVSDQLACETIGALADGKAVWFWHPLLVLNSRRRVGPTGRRQDLNPRMTVTRRIRRRGEHGISRKTIARGMPGLLRCTCGGYTRVFVFTTHEAAGALGTRHSLRPLFPGRTVFAKTRTHRAAGMRSRVDVIARGDLSAVAQRATASAEARRAKEEGGSDEAIQFAMLRYGLLRGACHRAALCADPLARNDSLHPMSSRRKPGPNHRY